jgi:hypothetical protein
MGYRVRRGNSTPCRSATPARCKEPKPAADTLLQPDYRVLTHVAHGVLSNRWRGDDMNHTRLTTLTLLLALAALGPAAAHAEDDADDSSNELVVFGGISLLDVSSSRETTIDVGRGTPAFGAMMPGRSGRFGRVDLPAFTVPVTIGANTSLGSAALFGARYSRRIKDRLAVEADLQLAPGHELESGLRGCVAGVCIGAGQEQRARGGAFVGGLDFEGGFGDRNVNAWHYGAGLAYEITGGDVRPLVLLGAGGVTYDGTRGADTSFVLRFGLGLKILFGRVGARVDVVDHLVLDQFASGDTEHDVHATAGLLVRF